MRSLKVKFLFLFSLFVVLPTSIQFFITYQNNHQALKEKAFDKLKLAKEEKISQLKWLFKKMENNVISLSANPLISESMEIFNQGFQEIAESNSQLESETLDLKRFYQKEFTAKFNQTNPNQLTDTSQLVEQLAPQAKALQYLYISNNKHPLGNKDKLINAEDESLWSKEHEKVHSFYRTFAQTYGYYDIFLVDLKTGNIVYSVFKEIDFATSLRNGPFKDTNLAKLYRKIRDSQDLDEVHMVDLGRYTPSYNLPAGFIGKPIVKDGEKIGALIFQIPVEKINNIMTSEQKWKSNGYGNSAETYLVGEDKTMRSQSRFLVEDKPGYLETLKRNQVKENVLQYIDKKSISTLAQSVSSQAVQLGLQGKTGEEIILDYRGVPVFSAWEPLDIYGLNWVILSEIDQDEVYSSIYQLAQEIALALFAILIIALGFAWFIAKRIATPISQAKTAIEALAAGDLTQDLEVKSRDEVGQISQSINETTQKIKEVFGSDKIEWLDMEKMKKAERAAQEQARIDKEAAVKAKNEAEKAMQQAQIEKEKAQEQKKIAESESQKAQSTALEAQAAREKAEESQKEVQSLLQASEKSTQELAQKVQLILSVVELAANGDLSQSIPLVGDDPVGQVAKSLNKFFDQIRKDLIQISESANLLLSSSNDLKLLSSTLTSNVEQANNSITQGVQNTNVIEDTMTNLKINMEQMVASIKSISESTLQTNRITSEATEHAKEANQLIEKLDHSSSEISSVIKLISEIADQTNLLALNATIEAARAGESGKGFAVVASEVKELAKQTAVASVDITEKINKIQESSKEAISSINIIGKSIEDISQSSNTVSAAMEEQSSTTRQVNHIVLESTEKLKEVVESMGDIKNSNESTSECVGENARTAEDLATLSNKLSDLVHHFKLQTDEEEMTSDKAA